MPAESRQNRDGAERSDRTTVPEDEDAKLGEGEGAATLCVARLAERTVELKVEKTRPIAVAVKGKSMVYDRQDGSVTGAGPIGMNNPARLSGQGN